MGPGGRPTCGLNSAIRLRLQIADELAARSVWQNQLRDVAVRL
jgi:hypothetical protein